MNTTQRFRKTPKGVLTNLYSKMGERNRKKGFGDLPFTLKELHDRYLRDTAYLKLFESWEASGFEKEKKPSFDRTNPTIGYSFQNMELKTWGENRAKADWEKSFVYTTPVVMCDKNGVEIREFGSTKEASKMTGIPQSGITACCQGLYKQTHGYIFRYRGDKFKFKKSHIHDNPELLKEADHEGVH